MTEPTQAQIDARLREALQTLIDANEGNLSDVDGALYEARAALTAAAQVGPQMTPEIITEYLRSRIADTEVEAFESHKVAMNSYGAGYDRGFADALKEALREITGVDY